MSVEDQEKAIRAGLDRIREVRLRRHAAFLESLATEARQVEALGDIAASPSDAREMYSEALSLLALVPERPLDQKGQDVQTVIEAKLANLSLEEDKT